MNRRVQITLDSPQDTPLRPERLVVGSGRDIARDNWAVGATVYNMSYTDQLVATGLLNDVGNRYV